MSSITQILDEAKDIKPIAEKNGAKVYNADDYVKAVQAEIIDPTPDMGTRMVNRDGSIAKSRSVAEIVDEKALYGNLGTVVKKGVGGTELWIAPQAIAEDYEFVANPSYTPHKVKVFVFKSGKDDNGKMHIDRVEMMNGADARSKLVKSYSEEVMKECLELISKQGQEITKEESPFN